MKEKTMTFDEIIDRRVPLAVAFALFLQLAAAIWWAATKDSDDHFQQQRITVLEQQAMQTKDSQAQVIERLARIEERVNDELFMLGQLEKRLGASQH